MMPFFDFMKEQVVYLLSLWANEDIAKAIGANFLYIILSIWLTWIVVNIYVIRPITGSLFGVAVSVYSREQRKSKRDAQDAYSKSYENYKENRSRKEHYASQYVAEKRQGS